MPESNKPFVITDRRKFTKEGELRPDAEHTEPRQEARPEPTPAAPVAAQPTQQTVPEPAGIDEQDTLPAPTAEQAEQSRFAYEQTADRLDTAIRAADPGGDHPPPMNFDGLVQSLYITAIMQLGGATPEGEKPRVDILGARQSIDMLAVLGDKTKGNLSPQETKLLDSALFELRMAFLEITQALTRSAAARGSASPTGSQTGPTSAPKPGIIL